MAAAGDRDWRLILSRKGFDSSYGGMASPILPDGRLLHLPIPNSHDDFRMADMDVPGVDFGQLLVDLSCHRKKAGDRHTLQSVVHIDPDLDRAVRHRMPGWRPALGQTDAAQRHLANQGVGSGDVFLFFGWFREVMQQDGKWRFSPGAPDRHAFFGWLQIDELLPIVTDRESCLRDHPWIANHPHVYNKDNYKSALNTLYVATDRFRNHSSIPGGGRFPNYSPDLNLTAADASRSIWDLPGWLMPRDGQKPLSYHGDLKRWTQVDKRCRLRSAAKGQEFVLQASDYPEASPWLDDLLQRNARPVEVV